VGFSDSRRFLLEGVAIINGFPWVENDINRHG
jgi:hypothetical protein